MNDIVISVLILLAVAIVIFWSNQRNKKAAAEEAQRQKDAIANLPPINDDHDPLGGR